MGDLGKSKREERSTFEQGSTGGNYPGGVNYPGGQGGGSSTPLAAFGSLDNRLDMSQAVMHQPPPNFRIEDGVVVPDDARLKKARRRGPGIGGGRWQRFAFLTAMLLAMALLMVLGMSRLIAGVLVADPKLPPGTNFPREAAAGYVARFNKIFFSWDANNPKDRRDALASYFPKLAASNESAFGWNQEGVQAVSDTPVALRIDTSSDHRAVITTGMSIMIPQPNQQPNRVDFVCSAVSVYAKSKDSMVIDSYPALVSCPKPADINVEDDTPDLDQKNTPSIQRVLTSFFTAFAASDPNALNPTVARSADVGDGFHGARQLAGLSPRVLAPKKGDDPDVRQVRVRVNWAQPGQPQDLQTLPSTPSDYLVTVQKSDNAGGWIVLKLQPTLPSPELQPNSSSQDGGNSDGAAPSGSPNTSGSNGGKPLNGDTQGGTNTLPSTTP